MNKDRSTTRKSQLFLIRHSRYRIALIMILILIGIFVLLFAIFGSQLPSKVWLPESSLYESGDEAMLNLPIKSETVFTKYGRAIRYTSTADWSTQYKDTKPWTTIYEFSSSPLLKSSSCPNITHAETLLPSGCDILGSFQEQPVYTMQRSLPSGATEYYVKLGQTFIYIKSKGDGGVSLNYLNTFVSLSHDKVSQYLEDNGKLINSVKAKQQAEKNTTDQNNALAYTRLDFTPALPTNLPSGWQLNTNATTNPIQIDGPDADHPTMVNIDYTNSKKQIVSVHSGKLSNFIVGAQCGPSPRYSMENLVCNKVVGKDYYEATLYNERNDFVRYLYRPVGDSLVISHIVVYADHDKRPGFPTELAKVQDTITLSAQPTDKSILKGSTYYRLFY